MSGVFSEECGKFSRPNLTREKSLCSFPISKVTYETQMTWPTPDASYHAEVSCRWFSIGPKQAELLKSDWQSAFALYFIWPLDHIIWLDHIRSTGVRNRLYVIDSSAFTLHLHCKTWVVINWKKNGLKSIIHFLAFYMNFC